MLSELSGLSQQDPIPLGSTFQFHVAFWTLSRLKAFDLTELPEVSLGVWYQLGCNCRVVPLLDGQRDPSLSHEPQWPVIAAPEECWCTICLGHVLVHMMDDMHWCTGSKWLGKIEDTQFTYSSFALHSITRQSERWARVKCTRMCWRYQTCCAVSCMSWCIVAALIIELHSAGLLHHWTQICSLKDYCLAVTLFFLFCASSPELWGTILSPFCSTCSNI